MARFIPATFKEVLRGSPHLAPHIEHATSIHGSSSQHPLTYTNLLPSSCMPIHFFSVYETTKSADHLRNLTQELESTLIFHTGEFDTHTTLAHAYSTLSSEHDQVSSVYIKNNMLCVGRHNNAHVALWNVSRNTIASTRDLDQSSEITEAFSLDDTEYVIILGSQELWNTLTPANAFTVVHEILHSSGNVADAAEQLTDVARTFGTATSVVATVLWINPSRKIAHPTYLTHILRTLVNVH